jgi:hypothetical protein
LADEQGGDLLGGLAEMIDNLLPTTPQGIRELMTHDTRCYGASSRGGLIVDYSPWIGHSGTQFRDG